MLIIHAPPPATLRDANCECTKPPPLLLSHFNISAISFLRSIGLAGCAVLDSPAFIPGFVAETITNIYYGEGVGLGRQGRATEMYENKKKSQIHFVST